MPETFSPPGPADIRSPLRLVWWLIARQGRRIAAGAVLGSLWMISLAVPPYLLARAVDDGLAPKDSGALIAWVAALFGIGAVNAALGIARHRTMTKIRMDASFRIVRATIRQATYLGATLPGRVSAGEVATLGMGDVQVIAQSLTATGPGCGAVVAYVAVAVLLLSISPLLAVVVLAGVPLIVVVIGPLLHRLQRVDTGYREHQGALTTRLVDVVTGLRVIGGLGGQGACASRYRRDSQALREKGYRVGAVGSWVAALGNGLPALFLAVVTWLAVRLAAQGSITIGELLAVYGYVAVLVIPVSFFIEGGGDIARAVVSARRVTQFLSLTHDQADRPAVAAAPPSPAGLRDPVSGVEIQPAVLTVLAGARHADAVEIVDRLGRFADSAATWGGIRLDTISLDQIRGRILVADNDADLFAGSVREIVAGCRAPDDRAASEAIHAAVATDIVQALPDGLGSVVSAQGSTLSGGQRQRLRLARAGYADPDILLAVEPTSAVDAHTEALMAARLRGTRQGRTTVVTSTSPLVLDQADVVIYLVDGRVAATGTHHDLLATDPGYSALVSRGSDQDVLR